MINMIVSNKNKKKAIGLGSNITQTYYMYRFIKALIVAIIFLIVGIVVVFVVPIIGYIFILLSLVIFLIAWIIKRDLDKMKAGKKVSLQPINISFKKK